MVKKHATVTTNATVATVTTNTTLALFTLQSLQKRHKKDTDATETLQKRHRRYRVENGKITAMCNIFSKLGEIKQFWQKSFQLKVVVQKPLLY